MEAVWKTAMMSVSTPNTTPKPRATIEANARYKNARFVPVPGTVD